MIKVLLIGQLPMEVGGSYTTGVARVLHSLSSQSIDGVKFYMYVTNVPYKRSLELSQYPNQYVGFRYFPFKVIKDILFRPVSLLRQWKHYKKVCHTNPLRMEVYKINFEKIIKDVQPDLIHIHGAGLAPLHFASNSFHIPIVRTFHGLVYKGNQNSKYSKVGDEARGNAGFADYYTALTEENKNEVANLGISRDVIEVIPNGIDSKTYYFSALERNKLRTKLLVSEDTVVFVTVGLVVDRKGQFSFLKILEKSNINYQYWILGNGPDVEVIQDYIEKNNIVNKVRLFGQINGSDIFKYLSAADIYSLASSTEGQSLAEIEAYSTGLKVLVNKLVCRTVIGDAFHDKDTYFIMDFDEPNIEDFIDWSSQRPVQRDSRTMYDWTVIANRYGEMYKRVLKK